MFQFPTGIAVDKNGDLYITEKYCIRKINVSEGTVITIAGQTAELESNSYQDRPTELAMFNHLQGIAVSEDGSIYAADMGNNCIRKIKNGIVSTVGQRLKYPREITLDVAGNILVVDENGLSRVNASDHSIVASLVTCELNCLAIHRHNIYASGGSYILKIMCVSASGT